MCLFSAPKAPPVPSPSEAVAASQDKAQQAKKQQEARLAHRRGGRAFLDPSHGFSGIANTLLGAQVNSL